ncbi:hypothetical protein XOO3916 [Xanthomonas oryzae pv. oryzae KACC 10331]|uniref:Uncharacterized protein n=1 Tax=Xanthomonas oryzae pv. oryzae (strain KACC10331 / KXO85) TaxID=291331 RepID=Q5GVV2_XANOR|nr:hypothetical protein XOO3916 [Xanthomonas oryzae pv. oryzae KACC 10331]
MRRIRRGHARGFGQVHTEPAHAVAHGGGHVQCRTGQCAVGIAHHAIQGGDGFAVQVEAGAVAADHGHGVGDQQQLAAWLGRERHAQAGRVHMHAIDDDAAPHVGVFQRCADCIGFAASQLRHRVVHVREAAHPGSDAVACLLVSRRGVASEHDRAAGNEGTDIVQRHALGCERDQGDAVVQRCVDGNFVRVRQPELVFVMRALACRAQVRAFQMDAEHAGHALRDGCAGGLDRFGHHLRGIADQGRQHAGGAETTMRGGDGRQRLRVACVVEQYATAAVDLDVDKAWQQGGATQIHARGGLRNACIIGRHNRLDLRASQHHDQAVLQAVIGEYTRIAQCLSAGSIHVQTVSVTLFKCGGRSGLLPRCSASALIAR